MSAEESLRCKGSNARVGKSSILVVESDESDGSFLKLAPILAVVTNIDREHLDHYASLDEIKTAFTDFVNKVPFYGAAVLCMEDPNIQQIFPNIRRRTITYGRSAQVDLQILNITSGIRAAVTSHYEGKVPIWAIFTSAYPAFTTFSTLPPLRPSVWRWMSRSHKFAKG